MRVVSWNLDYHSDQSPRLPWLWPEQSSVVLLQEANNSVMQPVDERWSGPVVFSVDLHPRGTRKWSSEAVLLPAGSQVHNAGLIDGLWRPQRGLWVDATVPTAGRVTWVSWHGDNAQPSPRKGLSREEKRRIKNESFKTVGEFVSGLDGPVVLAADINSWRDPVELQPADPDSPSFEEHRFVGPEPPHGLDDAWRLILARTGRLEQLRDEQPDGPLAVSYHTGSAGHRFDRIWVSPSLVPTAGGYDRPGGLAAGSDHAIVWVDLEPES